MNGVITMRDKDLERIKVMQRLALRQITQLAGVYEFITRKLRLESGRLLHITDRQGRKLFKRYQATGDKGVISKNLEKTSNRHPPQETKKEALKLISERSRCSTFL